MPPKRKKPTPVVVGTVSTRSTRRESIVNIEIIPKTNKVSKPLPPQRKSTKSLSKATGAECETEETTEIKYLEETRPDILEILKDWSDEESSQDCNILPLQASSSGSSTLASDQQSLIDILEGKQCDNMLDVSLDKASKEKHLLIDNVVVNIDSPKVGESEIIEECVVEDDNIIIVLPEEQSEDGGNVGKDIPTCNENNEVKGDLSQEKDNIQPGASERDEWNAGNFEVIEEQTVCDNSESSENALCHKMTELMNVSHKSDDRPCSDHITDTLQDGISKIAIKNEAETYSEADISPALSRNKKIKKTLSSDNNVSPGASPNVGKTNIECVVEQAQKNEAPEAEAKENDYFGVSLAMESNLEEERNVEALINDLHRCDEANSSVSKALLQKNQNKMDVDSESSETKSSELDGDSTSNESSQNQASNSSIKDSTNALLDTLLSSPETSISVKKSPKETKPKIKKVGVAAAFKLEDSIALLRSEIDATIDEVLRKYTCDDSDVKSKDSNKKKKHNKSKQDKSAESSEEVRRSDRIKTILPVKKKSHGLVKSKSESLLCGEAENSDSSSVHNDSDKPTPSASPQLTKADKAKTKSKSADNVQLTNAPDTPDLPKVTDMKADKTGQAEIEARLKTFTHLKENQYKTDRQVCKEAREMICDCYLAEEDIQKDEYGCGEDCLNRLLMIECGHLCQVGDRCTNKRFQKSMFAPVEVFKTEKKGLGLRAAANIAYGEFILEYIGEVLDPDEFDKRAEVYSKDKNIHFYFMSLRADAIIDATMKGNISRFINHSCDPNAETQKWTVNGELRIGFFSTRTILAGEEITFDYRFQRYGKEAQKCFCEATICRGWLGERPVESEDDEEEDEEELAKASAETAKPHIKMASETPMEQPINKESEKIIIDSTGASKTDAAAPELAPAALHAQETPKKVVKKKVRKELLYDDFDQLNGDIEMLVTTGLKNQAHTLKLSRLMVRAKDLEQRKKLLRVLRRGELPCRRLFLDYHGLRLMHGYMIDAQQLGSDATKVVSSKLEIIQTKLELLQTLAVLPIQNKTMLIESKVLPAVEKWAKNEDIIEDGDQREEKKRSLEKKRSEELDPVAKEKVDEIKFLATKLLEEWVNLKESFRIPKKQRIEQMKEHEKEANRKFVESNSSSYSQEKESSRKHDQRHRSWSRYKSERESKRTSRSDDKDRPSAEFLKISKHERRKLFALQMELKEEERRLKQREMWRQHEMNCMMIGADPRFTAPFDPSKGFQYIWNPSVGQWQALPVPSAQNQGVFNSPASQQASFNVGQSHKTHLLGPFQSPVINMGGITGAAPQYPGLQATLPPLVPGLATSTMANSVPVVASSLAGSASGVPGMSGSLHGLSGSIPGISGHSLPLYQDVKQEDPSQVKFAGPIPPPAKLPPKWKCAKDKYGRPYYYHIKIRKSQWEPPPFLEPVLDDTSDSTTSDSSSGCSSDSSLESDADDEIDDAKLFSEVKKQMESTSKVASKSAIPEHIKKEGKDSVTPSPEVKAESDNEDDVNKPVKEEKSEPLSSIDIRLKEQFNLDSNEPPKKKRRTGLCQEIIISPRTEEDRKQFKEDLKRYKATKEKLKRQKEQMLLQAKKKPKTTASSDDIIKKPKRSSKSKSRIKDMKEWNDEHARKIKEVFRSTMATTVVSVLNAYRKPDCKEARITNTEDFKHLARKLTHFVMLKEIKHIATIDDLVCSDNVKSKAREYIRKYMSKFGEVYQKRHDEPDFKD